MKKIFAPILCCLLSFGIYIESNASNKLRESSFHPDQTELLGRWDLTLDVN